MLRYQQLKTAKKIRLLEKRTQEALIADDWQLLDDIVTETDRLMKMVFDDMDRFNAKHSPIVDRALG